MCHENEEWCKNRRGIDFSVQNWHEQFDKFWFKHSKISKICTLMGCLWPKYIMFDLKKYRGVMFDGTEYWCKIWRKTDFCFQKWHKEFGKFLPEHLILLNPKWKIYELKIYRGTICHEKMQNWKRNWLVVPKLRWVLWWILTRALKNLKNLHFNGLPLTKSYNVWAK